MKTALITGLHRGYIRKIRQRDAGGDAAWQRWRDNNPQAVRRYSQQWNAKRGQRNRVHAFSTGGPIPC